MHDTVMSSVLLCLEDCLEDSPQTRALIGVFEQDAEELLAFAQDINAVCRRISQAQNELATATQALTQKLKDFRFMSPAGSSEKENINSTIQQLAASIDEVSSYNTVLYSELSENMEYHSQRFLDKDLSEYLRLKSSFQNSDKVHEEASAKLARVSKKQKSEKGWQEATDQLYAARKSFHNTSMSYCCCLNELQSKKKIALFKPIISYLRSQIIFFRMGVDLGKTETEEVLHKLNEDLLSIEKASKENQDLLIERMDRLDASSTRAYIPDPPASMDFPDLPVDMGKTQISGYLFCKSNTSLFSRFGLLSQWHRNYFFTQGGNLMQQSKKEVAGQLFMDLDGCSVGVVEADDRRNVFQIISADGKHSCTLQGESKHQCEEWIATVRNISTGLYLEDNPREAIDRARQASMSESSSASQISEPKQESGVALKSDASSPHGQGEKSHPRSSSFEKKHEAFKPPSMFARLKQAASNLITPEEKPAKEEAPPSQTSPAQVEQPSEPVQKHEPQDGNDRASGDTSLDMVLDSNDPILFDLPSPMTSEAPPLQKSEDADNSEKLSDLNVDETTSPQTRQNPFTGMEEQENNEESSFKAMFIVRFLGCKRVSPDSDFTGTIADTIWQVMTARALHKMFRMNELHLIVSDKTLRLVDPATQLSRETIPVSSVLKTKTHNDNPRLLGFVARHSGSGELLCYTFESNADGDDVCCAINTALVMQQSKVEHEESQKQREMVMDLEEQSRLIAASHTEEKVDQEEEEEKPKDEGALEEPSPSEEQSEVGS